MDRLILSNAYDDLTGHPYRYIDMVDYAEYKKRPVISFDPVNETLDGTQTIYQRARRLHLVIPVDGMPLADYETLLTMQADRQEVCLESDIGQYTKVLAPMERATNNLCSAGDDGTYARATVASYQGADDKLYGVASGVKRFESCKIGNGILLEPASTNYFYPSHGASGSLIWTVDTGSPTIVWDTTINSNVGGEYGVLRINGNAGDIVHTTISGLTATTDYSLSVWLKGKGTIALNMKNVVAPPQGTGATVLTNEWTQFIVENKEATGTSIELEIIISENDTEFHVSAHQLENSHVITSYIPTTVSAVTRNIDQFYFTPADFNYVEGSIAFWLVYPRMDADNDDRTLFRLSDNFKGFIMWNNDVKFYLSSTLNIGGTMLDLPGDLVHLAFVWKDNYAAIIRNGVALASTTNNDREIASHYIFMFYDSAKAPCTVLGNIRIDSHYVEWRSSESGNEYDKYTVSDQLQLLKLTRARKFRIRNVDLNIKPANTEHYDGSFELIESGSDKTNTFIEG